MVAPPEMTATCVGSEGIPPDVIVRGTVDGEKVDFSVRECDLPDRRTESALLWLQVLGLR